MRVRNQQLLPYTRLIRALRSMVRNLEYRSFAIRTPGTMKNICPTMFLQVRTKQYHDIIDMNPEDHCNSIWRKR